MSSRRRDLVEHVALNHSAAILIQPGQQPPHDKEHPRRLATVIRHQHMTFARRLVPDVASSRRPFVFQVSTLAGDRVRDDLMRVAVAIREGQVPYAIGRTAKLH